MNDQLDGEIRALLGHLEDMTPLPPTFDELAELTARRGTSPSPARRLLVLAATAVVVAGLIGGLIAILPTGPATAPTATQPPPTLATSTAAPPSTPSDAGTQQVSLEDARWALPDIVIDGGADQQLLELSVEGGYTARVIGHPSDLAPPGSDLCISEVMSVADGRTCVVSDELGGLLVVPGLDVRGAPEFVILTAGTVTITSDACTPSTASTANLALTLCVLTPGSVEANISFTTPAGPALQVRFTHPDQ